MKVSINWDELNGFSGYVVAAFSDDHIVGMWPEKKEIIMNKQRLLLELRLFDEKKEIKYCRGNIGDDNGFYYRVKEDGNNKNDYYDEEQLLDLDDKDRIPLGLSKNATITIRNYISKDSKSGQAYVSDWRCVRFGKVSENYGKK